MKGNKEPTSESVVAALVALSTFTLFAKVEAVAGKVEMKLKLASVDKNVLLLAEFSCLEGTSNERADMSPSIVHLISANTLFASRSFPVYSACTGCAQC